MLLYPPLSFSPDPHSIPVVVTLVTERGQGDQMLLTGVRNRLDSLRQQLRVEISVAAVSRFGKLQKILLIICCVAYNGITHALHR